LGGGGGAFKKKKFFFCRPQSPPPTPQILKKIFFPQGIFRGPKLFFFLKKKKKKVKILKKYISGLKKGFPTGKNLVFFFKKENFLNPFEKTQKFGNLKNFFLKGGFLKRKLPIFQVFW
jgi:hypothetical protein